MPISRAGGHQEAGKCNLIVVVLSFNGVPGYGQIEVDSPFAESGPQGWKGQ